MAGGPAPPLAEYIARREAGDRWCGSARHWVRKRDIVGGQYRCFDCHNAARRLARIAEQARPDFEAGAARLGGAGLERVIAVMRLGQRYSQPFEAAWDEATTCLRSDLRGPVEATKVGWRRAYANAPMQPFEAALTRIAGMLDMLDDADRVGREPVFLGRPARET